MGASGVHFMLQFLPIHAVYGSVPKSGVYLVNPKDYSPYHGDPQNGSPNFFWPPPYRDWQLTMQTWLPNISRTPRLGFSHMSG